VAGFLYRMYIEIFKFMFSKKMVCCNKCVVKLGLQQCPMILSISVL